MSVQIIRGNALALPLPDDSVDLVVTSPPYFGLRSYQDGGEHYDGQIGAEATPAEFVDALIAATREMVRVVKPTGSIWVNLGDKYAGGNNGPHGGTVAATDLGRSMENGGKGLYTSYPKSRWGGIPNKSLIGIPWRYALRCIDDLGLILRAEVIWSKPNGLPESVTDRVRRSHEQWFCFQQEQSGGQVVEPSSHGLPLCSLCGRPADTRATLIARLHELDPSIQDADLSDQVRTDERVQGERGVRSEQPGVVGLGGTTVPLPVPGDADLIENAADLLHDGQVPVVDDDAEVRAAGAPVAEGDRALSVDDSGEPGEVCSCSHPLIIDDEPWIPQEVAAEIMQLVADGEVDPQQAADFLSGDYARSHSTWFHFTLNPRYYSAVDEVREQYDQTAGAVAKRRNGQRVLSGHDSMTNNSTIRSALDDQRKPYENPLGKLPSSVWTIPTEPLRVPDHLGIDHFAAFPTEWPRRIITGWSPRGVCAECGAGRRPVIGYDGPHELAPRRVLTDTETAQAARLFVAWQEREGIPTQRIAALFPSRTGGMTGCVANWRSGANVLTPEQARTIEANIGPLPEDLSALIYKTELLPVRGGNFQASEGARKSGGTGAKQFAHKEPPARTITGEACDCPEPTAPTTHGVVLDPFGGTGTTALVADALGRHGISVDMSADYCRLAEWRTTDPKQRAKAARREFTPAPEQVPGQASLLDLLGGESA